MNRWGWIVILLIILSLAVMVVGPLMGWGVWLPHPGWGAGRIPERFTALGRPLPLISTFSVLLTLYLTGILLMYMFPRRMKYITRPLATRPQHLLQMALLGFLTGLLVVATGLTSAMTMGTFPLTILLFAVLFLGSFFGLMAVAYTLGRTLMQRAGWGQSSPVAALLLGQLILFALERLPGIGSIFLLVFSSLGLGAVIVSHFGSGEPWNLNPLMEADQQ